MIDIEAFQGQRQDDLVRKGIYYHDIAPEFGIQAPHEEGKRFLIL